MAKCFTAALLAAAFAMSMSGSVSAHAGLTRCSIKNNQVFRVGHAPRQITAFFAEPLDPAKSWVAVFEGVGDHGLVTEKQHSIVSFKNPKEMMLQLPRLVKEKYYIIWYTYSSVDNHVASGIVYFQVR